MRAGEEKIWQRFVYENLDELCLQCGMVHAGAQCQQSAAEVGAAGAADDSGTRGAGPRLGPWVLAVRRRLPAGGGGVGTSRLPGDPAKEGGSATGEGWMKPARVARRPPPAPPTPVVTTGDRGSERGKTGNPFSALDMEGKGGRAGGSLCPPSLPKRARPNEDKGSPSSVQAASSSKLGPDRGQARSRKLGPKLVKGKVVAMGMEQTNLEVGRGTGESGIFLFNASDRGRSGVLERPTPTTEDGQLSVAQVVDPMLVSVQAVPGSAEFGVPQSGDQSAVVGVQETPRGSPALGHDLAVSRLRQAIQGDGEGPPDGGAVAVASVDEDLMSGDEDAVQIPNAVSS